MNSQTPSPTHRLSTPEEVAAFLRIDRLSLLNNVRRGKIPAIRLNSRVMRFHLPDVMAALHGGVK